MILTAPVWPLLVDEPLELPTLAKPSASTPYAGGSWVPGQTEASRLEVIKRLLREKSFSSIGFARDGPLHQVCLRQTSTRASGPSSVQVV